MHIIALDHHRPNRFLQSLGQSLDEIGIRGKHVPEGPVAKALESGKNLAVFGRRQQRDHGLLDIFEFIRGDFQFLFATEKLSAEDVGEHLHVGIEPTAHG